MANNSEDSRSPKKIEEILSEQIGYSLKEHQRPKLSLFLSSLAAGMEVGFSYFTICVFHYLFVNSWSPEGLHVIAAVAYPIGFIFVVIGRSELFTEHTTLAVLPVFAGLATFKSLMVLWITIFIGNLIGGYLFSLLFVSLAPAMDIASKSTFYEIAHHVLDYDTMVIFSSAMLAGWLMGLLAWLTTAATDTISRIFIIILITTVIGLGGLHHSIVGSIEVFSGLITSDKITFLHYINFQTFATLGNIVGGVVFVAIIKYGHTKVA